MSLVGSTVGEESGPASGVSSDDAPPADAVRFCSRWIRRSAFSFCRSNRRNSFWRFLKLSMCPNYCPAPATRGQSCRYTLPLRLPPRTPTAVGAAREPTTLTFHPRTRYVNVERPAFHVGPVRGRNCPIRLDRIRHPDESETDGPPVSRSVIWFT